MLRPATPLAILFFVAFVLLLLSTISTPVVKGIPLASFRGVNYGVFGYCKGDTCSSPQVGYKSSTWEVVVVPIMRRKFRANVYLALQTASLRRQTTMENSPFRPARGSRCPLSWSSMSSPLSSPLSASPSPRLLTCAPPRIRRASSYSS